MLQHRLKIFQIEQKKLMIVSNLKGQAQHGRLRVIEIEQTAEKQRSHFGRRGPHRMTLLSENVPEGDRVGKELEIGKLELLDARVKLGIVGAGLTYAREVALHIGSEHRDTDPTE